MDLWLRRIRVRDGRAEAWRRSGKLRAHIFKQRHKAESKLERAQTFQLSK